MAADRGGGGRERQGETSLARRFSIIVPEWARQVHMMCMLRMVNGS
jgi:hypothetical protein